MATKNMSVAELKSELARVDAFALQVQAENKVLLEQVEEQYLEIIKLERAFRQSQALARSLREPRPETPSPIREAMAKAKARAIASGKMQLVLL